MGYNDKTFIMQAEKSVFNRGDKIKIIFDDIVEASSKEGLYINRDSHFILISIDKNIEAIPLNRILRVEVKKQVKIIKEDFSWLIPKVKSRH